MNPFARTTCPTTPGACYTLPDGWTWLDVVAQRKKWDHSPKMAPLACAGGTALWGVPMHFDVMLS